MITAISERIAYQTLFASNSAQGIADAPIDKGGGGAGFDPHELLEAALATCINIVVRKRAVQLGVALEDVSTIVRLDRSRPDAATFEYELDIRSSVSAEQHLALLESAKTCPVNQTLAKRIEFRCATANLATRD